MSIVVGHSPTSSLGGLASQVGYNQAAREAQAQEEQWKFQRGMQDQAFQNQVKGMLFENTIGAVGTAVGAAAGGSTAGAAGGGSAAAGATGFLSNILGGKMQSNQAIEQQRQTAKFTTQQNNQLADIRQKRERLRNDTTFTPRQQQEGDLELARMEYGIGPIKVDMDPSPHPKGQEPGGDSWFTAAGAERVRTTKGEVDELVAGISFDDYNKALETGIKFLTKEVWSPKAQMMEKISPEPEDLKKWVNGYLGDLIDFKRNGPISPPVAPKATAPPPQAQAAPAPQAAAQQQAAQQQAAQQQAKGGKGAVSIRQRTDMALNAAQNVPPSVAKELREIASDIDNETDDLKRRKLYMQFRQVRETAKKRETSFLDPEVENQALSVFSKVEAALTPKQKEDFEGVLHKAKFMKNVKLRERAVEDLQIEIKTLEKIAFYLSMQGAEQQAPQGGDNFPLLKDPFSVPKNPEKIYDFKKEFLNRTGGK